MTIEIMPLLDVRATVLELLIRGRDTGDVQMARLAVSMTEYLKDAERWQYVKHHRVPELPPDDFQRYVDEGLKK